MNTPLPGILAEIVARKREEVRELRRNSASLEVAVRRAPACRPFIRALGNPDRVGLIAECKRRSPGAGPIRPRLDAGRLALAYERAGAACLSVLTDRDFFGGSPDDLRAARAADPDFPHCARILPLILYRSWRRGRWGADAVLLIVRILPDRLLRALFDDAVGLGMDVLVETHGEAELERALAIGAGLIGINNRDLATFTTNLDTTLSLLERVPDDVTLVSESGIRDVEDVSRLGRAGVDAVLVGETLLRAGDPGRAARSLAGAARVERRVAQASRASSDLGKPAASAPAFKVCGLQRRADALMADRLGASYVGVIASEGFGRSVEPSMAGAMLDGIQAKRVAVMVNESVDRAARRALAVGAEVLQLHGEESAEDVASLAERGRWTVWKGVRADSAADVERAAKLYGRIVDGFVVEGRKEGAVGGVGARLRVPSTAIRPALRPEALFVLAGGLTPDNLGQASAQFEPDVLDVSSGIEREPGSKDPSLMRAFAAEVVTLGRKGRR